MVRLIVYYVQPHARSQSPPSLPHAGCVARCEKAVGGGRAAADDVCMYVCMYVCNKRVKMAGGAAVRVLMFLQVGWVI